MVNLVDAYGNEHKWLRFAAVSGFAILTKETIMSVSFLISEANGTLSRETITVAQGANLAAGTILAMNTATGKYVAVDPNTNESTGTAAGILFDAVDATDADAEGVAIVRLAEVNSLAIVWPDGINELQNEPQKYGILSDLLDRYIAVR